MLVEFLSYFFDVFLEKKMQKQKNWRSSFRIAKYNVSWGWPCSKKRARRWTNASFFALIFHHFSVKNRWKIAQKARKTVLRANIGKNPGSERLFLGKNRFFVDFWEFSGSPGTSRDVPETLHFSFFGGEGGFFLDGQPASQPTNQPANQPASQPANQPASQPTSQPDNHPLLEWD